MKDKPDILLIVLDTQRADKLSCYGHRLETSPHIDEFAQEATLFQHSVAPAQWTVPTHASMFTGLYPSQHTTHQMNSILPGYYQTVAERLGQAGYYSAGFSHNPLVGAVKNGLHRGFHKFMNYHTPVSGLLAFQFDQKKSTTSLMAKAKHYGRYFLAESLGYSHQTAFQHLSFMGQPLWEAFLAMRNQTKPASVRNSLDAAAKTLIERRNLSKEQPVFAFINLMGTHVPYAPPKWALEHFLPARLGKSHSNKLLQEVNKWQVDVRNWFDITIEHEEYQAILNAYYDAEVAEQDAQLGVFFKQLKKANLFDDTLIIILADHGDHLGEKQRLNHAFGVYEPLAHVPLIIHDPSNKLNQNTTIQQSVSTRRVFHTILSEAGVATVVEKSLSLTNWEESKDDNVLCEGYPLDWALQRLNKYEPARTASYQTLSRAIYGNKQKFISHGSQIELYDLAHDPCELHDLSQQMVKEKKEFSKQLEAFVSTLQPIAKKDNERLIEDEKIIMQLRNLGYLE